MAGHLGWAFFFPPSVHHTRSPILYWGVGAGCCGWGLVSDIFYLSETRCDFSPQSFGYQDVFTRENVSRSTHYRCSLHLPLK